MSDIKPQTPFVARSRLQGFLLATIVISGSVLLESLELGRGRIAVGTAFATSLLAVVMLSKPLWKKGWLWLVIAVSTALHAFAITALNWSAAEHWSGLILMPLMWADIIIQMGLIYILYRLIYGQPEGVVAEELQRKRYGERDSA